MPVGRVLEGGVDSSPVPIPGGRRGAEVAAPRRSGAQSVSGEADSGQNVPDAQSSANACSRWPRGRVHSGCHCSAWELNTGTRVTSLRQPVELGGGTVGSAPAAFTDVAPARSLLDGIGTRKPRGRRENAYDATGMCQPCGKMRPTRERLKQAFKAHGQKAVVLSF